MVEKCNRSVEYLGNDTEWGKPKYSEKHLFQCHFVHYKTHKDWFGIQTGPHPEAWHGHICEEMIISCGAGEGWRRSGGPIV
jgi:hypothetical protein